MTNLIDEKINIIPVLNAVYKSLDRSTFPDILKFCFPIHGNTFPVPTLLNNHYLRETQQNSVAPQNYFEELIREDSYYYISGQYVPSFIKKNFYKSDYLDIKKLKNEMGQFIDKTVQLGDFPLYLNQSKNTIISPILVLLNVIILESSFKPELNITRKLIDSIPNVFREYDLLDIKTRYISTKNQDETSYIFYIDDTDFHSKYKNQNIAIKDKLRNLNTVSFLFCFFGLLFSHDLMRAYLSGSAQYCCFLEYYVNTCKELLRNWDLKKNNEFKETLSEMKDVKVPKQVQTPIKPIKTINTNGLVLSENIRSASKTWKTIFSKFANFTAKFKTARGLEFVVICDPEIQTSTQIIENYLYSNDQPNNNSSQSHFDSLFDPNKMTSIKASFQSFIEHQKSYNPKFYLIYNLLNNTFIEVLSNGSRFYGLLLSYIDTRKEGDSALPRGMQDFTTKELYLCKKNKQTIQDFLVFFDYIKKDNSEQLEHSTITNELFFLSTIFNEQSRININGGVAIGWFPIYINLISDNPLFNTTGQINPQNFKKDYIDKDIKRIDETTLKFFKANQKVKNTLDNHNELKKKFEKVLKRELVPISELQALYPNIKNIKEEYSLFFPQDKTIFPIPSFFYSNDKIDIFDGVSTNYLKNLIIEDTLRYGDDLKLNIQTFKSIAETFVGFKVDNNNYQRYKSQVVNTILNPIILILNVICYKNTENTKLIQKKFVKKIEIANLLSLTLTEYEDVYNIFTIPESSLQKYSNVNYSYEFKLLTFYFCLFGYFFSHEAYRIYIRKNSYSYGYCLHQFNLVFSEIHPDLIRNKI
jgi:hypothetical protein